MHENGELDPGEPGWEGATIQLKQGERVRATTETDLNGKYVFEEVLPGTYEVVEVLDDGVKTGVSTIVKGVELDPGEDVRVEEPFLNYR